MKKNAIILAILCAQTTAAAYASELSDWVVSDYESLSRGGILTYDIVSQDLKAPIKRREVCQLFVKLYEQMSITDVAEKEYTFLDTDDENVKKAYSIGIVSGKSDTVFAPESEVTRQEFAKMTFNLFTACGLTFDSDDSFSEEILSEYKDGSDVASWAKNAMGVCIKSGIMNGTGSGVLSPDSNTSREQAICMINRIYERFCKKANIYDIPSLTGFESLTSGDMNFSWTPVSDAKKYMLLIKDSSAQLWDSFETSSTRASINCEDYLTDIYTFIIGVENKEGIQAYTTPSDIDFSVPVYTPVTFDTLSYAEKEARVFPTGIPFQNAEEAGGYMTSVTVPVWKIGSDGQKYASKSTLTVNSALAEDVVNIFTEIFNSPEQFPIKSVGGYYWRNTASGNLSQHSYGTCIDINPDENYYVTPDGVPITGSFWKPYENPYSIPEDGIVVETFKKYGWSWGGNCWSDKYSKDYMHFTYLGK